MPRNRVIYNTEAVYVGPAPSSGYHFIQGGVLNNSYNSLGQNQNLIKPLHRIQSANWSTEQNPVSIEMVGYDGCADQLNFNKQAVQLQFNYLQYGILNELRMGMYCNFITGNNLPIHSNNTGISLISGFAFRTNEQPATDPFWPSLYRDCRNIFFGINNSQDDFNAQTNKTGNVHPNVNSMSVLSFGDCYLNEYSTSAAVGSFPVASTSWVCENLCVENIASGFSNPAIHRQSGFQYTDVKCVLPSNYEGTASITALRPGDITMDITAAYPMQYVVAMSGVGIPSGNSLTNIYNTTNAFSDIKIQSYNLSLDLNRRPLLSIGYVSPVDYVLQYPIYCSLSVSALAGDVVTGSVLDLFRQNLDYNISIKLRNPANQVAVQYDLLRAKLVNQGETLAIGANKIYNFGFTTDLNPKNLTRGLFISGLLGMPVSGLFY